MDKDIKVRYLVIAIIVAIAAASIGVSLFLIARYQKPSPSQPQANTSSQDVPESTGATSHMHNYTAEVILATCENPGYTLYSCVCGDVYQADDVPASGHTYGEWRIVADATAEAEGEKEKVCTTCGNRITEAIPKLEAPVHKHTYTTTVVTATCTTGGYTKHICSCGDTYYSDKTPIRSHLYGDWEIIIQATIDSTGAKTCSCIRCGHMLTVTIPKLNPDVVEKYENYVDSRIEIEIRSDGARRFFYNPVCVVDIRTWGEPATIKITDEGGFYVTYLKQDGSKVELDLIPIEGYVRRMVIMEDGSYILSLIGSFDD